MKSIITLSVDHTEPIPMLAVIKAHKGAPIPESVRQKINELRSRA